MNLHFRWLILIFAALTACSSAPKTDDRVKLPPPETSAQLVKPPPIAPTTVVAEEPEEAPLRAEPKHKGVDPKQVRLWLEHGNRRFVKGWVRKDGQGKKDIKLLSGGQNPHAIVLSCSDSRVPPEIVFDQKLGEIFVVRTAGEALDPNVIASIEYALQHFGTRYILVMGHTSCGAIKAAVETPPGADAGSLALNHLVGDIQSRLKLSLAKGKPAPDMATEARENAMTIADELKHISPIVRAAVEKEGVVIQSALYHLNSGEVTFE